MALPDLTGQNIQDTYQRILTVGDGGHMFDGTGSIFVPLSASVEVTKEISSSHADTASYIDTSNIAQPFNNITASGDISASGHINTNKILLNNSTVGDYIEYSNDGFFYKGKGDFHTSLEVGTTLLVNSDITASGNISSSGNVYANRFGDNFEIIDSGNSTTLAIDSAGSAGNSGFNLAIDGITKIALRKLNYSTQFSGNTEFVNAITASGDISSSGTITGIINGGTF